MSSSADPGHPVGWKDVYLLVGEAEGRIVKKLDEWGERLEKLGTDHEVRIRALEKMVFTGEARDSGKGELWLSARSISIGLLGVGAAMLGYVLNALQK